MTELALGRLTLSIADISFDEQFQDRMYARKGSGGREAAHKLFEAVRDWAHQKLGGRREELQIIGLVFM